MKGYITYLGCQQQVSGEKDGCAGRLRQCDGVFRQPILGCCLRKWWWTGQRWAEPVVVYCSFWSFLLNDGAWWLMIRSWMRSERSWLSLKCMKARERRESMLFIWISIDNNNFLQNESQCSLSLSLSLSLVLVDLFIFNEKSTFLFLCP